MADKSPSYVDILTPALKKKVDTLEGGECKQFLVIPATENATLEELQEEALRWVQNRLDGKCETYDHFPEGKINSKTVQQFMAERGIAK